jgi:hypothetical protein
MLVMIPFNENLPAIEPFKNGKAFTGNNYIAQVVNGVFFPTVAFHRSTIVSSISSQEENGRNGEPSGCMKDKLLACPKWVSAVTKALIKETYYAAP